MTLTAAGTMSHFRVHNCSRLSQGGLISMRLGRLSHAKRFLAAMSLMGLLASLSGCGSSGGSESNVAPTTPPPGFSAQDQADAYKKAYGPKGIPKSTRLSAAP